MSCYHVFNCLLHVDCAMVLTVYIYFCSWHTQDNKIYTAIMKEG